MHQSSISIPTCQISLKSKKRFVHGLTVGRTDGRTVGRLRPTLLDRLKRVDLKRRPSAPSKIRIMYSTYVYSSNVTFNIMNSSICQFRAIKYAIAFCQSNFLHMNRWAKTHQLGQIAHSLQGLRPNGLVCAKKHWPLAIVSLF